MTLDDDIRASMASAAFDGCGASAFSLGYAESGVSGNPERSLYWYTLAARLGEAWAVYNAALGAVRVAYYDRPKDMKAGERALGWVALARNLFAGEPEADFLEGLRADILSLWPELEAWEWDAYLAADREVYGLTH